MRNEVNGYIAEVIENVGQGGGLQGLESKVMSYNCLPV